jgi:hypothetical protein
MINMEKIGFFFPKAERDIREFMKKKQRRSSTEC